MKIEFSMGDTALSLKVAFDMTAEEFMAMKKALMWCDFSKMTSNERQAVDQMNRTLHKINIPE